MPIEKQVAYQWQGEIIRGLGVPQKGMPTDADESIEMMIKKSRESYVNG